MQLGTFFPNYRFSNEFSRLTLRRLYSMLLGENTDGVSVRQALFTAVKVTPAVDRLLRPVGKTVRQLCSWLSSPEQSPPMPGTGWHSLRILFFFN